MKTKLFLFTLLALLLVSCSSESRMKSKIASTIEDSLENKDKDVEVKVTSVGEVYGCMWDTKNEEAIKAKIGSTKYETLLKKFGDIMSSGFAHNGNPNDLKKEAIEIDKTLKEHDIKPIDWYAMCNVTIRHKVYKMQVEMVCGVLYNEFEGNHFCLIPDKTSANESRIEE